MHSWNTFGAWMKHEQTRIHKTHHGLNLREATAFPLIGLAFKRHFVLGFSSWNPEIP
jgi:hypothetical protein